MPDLSIHGQVQERYLRRVKCKVYEYRGCIQREMLGMETYVGVDSGVQHSILVVTNANECVPKYSKMAEPIGKGRVRARGR
jgi:hypothetical protein